MKSHLSLFAIASIFTLHLCSAEPGEPPVISPYSDKLDKAATNKWWQHAKQAREAKIEVKNHAKGTITVTGRHFLDLEAPRDEVVAFALYTLHAKTLKLSAQLYPLFPDETRKVRLEIKKDGKWGEIATAQVNDLGWSALFRLENWDDSKDAPYRVLHGEKAMFEGLIRKTPTDKDSIVVASLSCNSSKDRMDRNTMVKSLRTIDPDLLFFAGDQHYDHTEHTAGWIMWGVQFRDIIKDRPTITIPDDHDVGHGNLWGEGGIKAVKGGNSGGYIHDAEYVKQVERCQTAHLPDPYDPTPVEQGIGVYYTNYHLAGIDFAILEDRKFKSGPGGKITHSNNRVDHIRDPEYDPKSIDVPGLVLLGERQLKFLDQWSQAWEGVKMKAVLSQSPFFAASHIHGGGDPIKNRLFGDLDSNGWPQTGRDKALRVMRKSFACHLTGDQHLATLAQHGIDEHNDGPWSLVSPSIVGKVYGRRWHPLSEKPGANANLKSPLPWTGEYLDTFHNKVTMHAYANPDKIFKGSGFVVARFDKKNRTITAECWPRVQDLSQPGAKQFPGWPVVIPQIDNYNPPSWGKLGELTFNRENPVVQIIDTDTQEVLYTLRIQGKKFTPHAPKGRNFTIKAGIHNADTVIVETSSVSKHKPMMITLP